MDYLKVYNGMKSTLFLLIGLVIGWGLLSIIMSFLLYVSYKTISELISYQPFTWIYTVIDSLFS